MIAIIITIMVLELRIPQGALYGVILLMNALAWLMLQTSLIRHEGRDSDLAKAIKTGFKERTSPELYVAGIWFIPDRRVERQLGMRA